MTSESSDPIVPPTEGGTQNEDSNTTSATPVLNRADRRAQSKGKKITPNNNIAGGFQGGNFQGGIPRTTAIQNKSRIPRTGHK